MQCDALLLQLFCDGGIAALIRVEPSCSRFPLEISLCVNHTVDANQNVMHREGACFTVEPEDRKGCLLYFGRRFGRASLAIE